VWHIFGQGAGFGGRTAADGQDRGGTQKQKGV
jgi:hypothetical protein